MSRALRAYSALAAVLEKDPLFPENEEMLRAAMDVLWRMLTDAERKRLDR